MIRVFLFSILLTFTINGCSTKKTKITLHSYTKPLKNKTPPYLLHKKNTITLALYEEYLKWHGVAYKFGGNSKRGIDCSALVETLYADAFGIRIPRTTAKQIKRGVFIAKNRLREGDIIFFKTGWKSMHSGIYLERGNFIHTSTKHGVTISNINNPYWKSKYLESRRLLNY
jgi:cell wall-associated NlpC family hydrolase